MRTRDFLSAILVIPLLIGCYSAQPRKAEPQSVQRKDTVIRVKKKAPDPAQAALEEIRKQYKAEFVEAVFPEPGKQAALVRAAMNGKGFPETLKAIRTVDPQYGTGSREHAHLIVLKGMIHLQTGQFRSASAMEPDIVKAASLLSSPPDLNRGGLIARNFKHLVAGWSEITKHNENLKARNAGKLFPFPSTNFGKIQSAADQIGEDLRSHAKENPLLIKDPESDLGGLHVASIAAAFYAKCAAQKREKKEKAVLYKKGSDLMGLFLTENEKNSAVRGQQRNPSISSCHLRYLSWYGWLSRRAHEAKSPNQRRGISSQQKI
ncbi:MAG: hypothetical protein PHS17_16810 [Desulfobacterales bacterium]|nr:hypothetical protein [Desulfobacterales bacterium]